VDRGHHNSTLRRQDELACVRSCDVDPSYALTHARTECAGLDPNHCGGGALDLPGDPAALLAGKLRSDSRRIADRIERPALPPQSERLTSLGGLNNQICDDLRHGRPQISRRFAGTVESLAHRQGRGVVEPNVLDRN
jgi:hypothetical protein